MTDNENKLKNIYNAFIPMINEKLDDYYVDYRNFSDLKTSNIKECIFKKITLSESNFSQLVSGHKGSGKTVQLLGLKQLLENEGYLPIYCPINDYININDYYYTDLILAMIKAFSIEFNKREIFINYTPLGDISLNRIKDFVDIKGLSFDSKFSIITDNTKYSDIFRETVHKNLDRQGYKLLSSFNKVLDDANKVIAKHNLKQIVFLIDGLDHVKSITEEEDNKIDSFLSLHINVLNELNSKIILNMPLSTTLFTEKTIIDNSLDNNHLIFSTPYVENESGLKEYFKAIISRRLEIVNYLIEDAFTEEYIDELISMSAGNISQVFNLIQESCLLTEALPISPEIIKKAASKIKINLLNKVDLTLFNKITNNLLVPESLTNKELNHLLSSNILLYNLDESKPLSLNPVLK